MNTEQEILAFKRGIERNYPASELEQMYNNLKEHVRTIDCSKTNCSLLKSMFMQVRKEWKIMQKVLND